MNKHLPGPWKIEDEAAIMASFEGDMVQIALMSETRWTYPDGGKTGRLRAMREANAHLIAAAPDLLKACQSLYCIMLDGMTDDYDYMTEQLGNAKAVIDKATGAGESHDSLTQSTSHGTM